MKAIGYTDPHPISDAKFVTFDLPVPEIGARDILVDVRAVSVNPVDTKVRRSRVGTAEKPVILGWDAAGVVVAVGADVAGFVVGDRVYYAGDLTRAGSNAELQAVDHRLAAKMPERLSFAEAAALPLTSLTAWEALFEKLRVPRGEASDVLVVGGAGGVGAIAVQLLKRFTPARVHATAGRPESRAFLESLGVTSIVDRHGPLGEADAYDFVFATTGSGEHWGKYPNVLKPFGAVCVIDDAPGLELMPFKAKSLSIHWEMMFTKSRFGFRPETQGDTLRLIARAIDDGIVVTTAATVMDGITVDNLVVAHRTLEAGTAVGKIVLARSAEDRVAGGRA